MSSDFDRLAELLDRAARHPSPAELAAFLDGACRGQPHLRREVESLLAVRDQAGDFLEATVAASGLRTPIEQVGDWIGRYRLLEKLGEGGCGVVYLAEQRQPVHRRVALKVIKVGMDTQSVVARFEAERQALAIMEHPSVAKVFDAGATDTGRPFFVMELVQGMRITEYCRVKRLGTEERLELFIKVCHAIQHAHQKGVIHRDIKPANILVIVNDGVPVPKVIDFGIAKAVAGRLTDQTVFTAYAQFLGTPAYMSPEQAALTSMDVDTRSDIYSLGVLLYELLTGTTPFDSRELGVLGLDEMLRTIREKEPVRPSTRLTQLRQQRPPPPLLANRRSPIANRLWPAGQAKSETETETDLDWIVMKCLEKDRSRRYETANGLAMDIGRLLANEPVLARPPSVAYRLQKSFRRNRGAFAAAALVAVALCGGVMVSAWQASVARREAARATAAELATAREARAAMEERDRALRAEAAADRSARQARRYAYVADLNLAAQALQDGNLARVRSLLQSQAPATGQEDPRDFEWRHLWKRSRTEAIRSLRLRPIPTCAAMFTPDGAKLITAQLYDQVRVFEPRSLRLLAALATNVLDVALSHDGQTLGVLRADGLTQVFDLGTMRERLNLTNPLHTASGLLISADGTTLAMAEGSQITVWDSREGRLRETIPTRERPSGVAAFAVSPDWSTFLTCDARHILLWDRAGRSLLRELPGHEGPASSAAFSADGRWLATGGWRDRRIRLWDARAQRLVAVFTNHNGWIGRLEFSPDGTTLASASSDHTIRLWDLAELQPKAVLRGHADEVWMVSFSADGRYLISGDRGGEVSLWNARPPPPESTGLSGDFLAGGFSSGGGAFLTFTREGLIQTWEVASLRELRREAVPAEPGASAAFAPGGGVLAVGRTDGRVQLHDPVNPGSMPILNHGPGGAVNSLRFSGDGRTLASVSRQELRVWDLASGGSVYQAPNPADEYWGLNSVALSPDGSVLAFAAPDLSVRIVHLPSRSERQIAPDLWGVLALAFSPDGQYLAGAGRDHRLKLWQTSDYQEVATIKSWRQSSDAMTFNPSSRRLAVALGEGGVRLIDLATTEEVGSLPAQSASDWVGFSPDGNCLAAHHRGGYLFWRAPSWEEIAAAEAKVGPGQGHP